MSGVFGSVNKGETVTVNNNIGGQYYFFPSILNNTKQTCKVIVNEGLSAEQYPGTLPGSLSPNDRIDLGYYVLLPKSNIVVYCKDKIVRWWGMRRGKGDKLDTLTEKHSGLIELELKP